MAWCPKCGRRWGYSSRQIAVCSSCSPGQQCWQPLTPSSSLGFSSFSYDFDNFNFTLTHSVIDALTLDIVERFGNIPVQVTIQYSSHPKGERLLLRVISELVDIVNLELPPRYVVHSEEMYQRVRDEVLTAVHAFMTESEENDDAVE